MSEPPDPLGSTLRLQVEQFVRPLYVGLDGAAGFDRVSRLRRHAAALAGGGGTAATGAGGRGADPRLLELLLLFHGVVDRLGSLAPGGRLDLFLRSAGVGEELARRVRTGLGRLAAAPSSAEEALIHDALLLAEAGVAATAERLMAAGRRRLPLARVLAQLDPGASPERYRTEAGIRLGAARREEALAWLEELRRRLEEGDDPGRERSEGKRGWPDQFTGTRPPNPSS
ncbi:MAG TPA: hypothetical protein VIH93_17020 [Thermoanaerobaculia bacterium]